MNAQNLHIPLILHTNEGFIIRAEKKETAMKYELKEQLQNFSDSIHRWLSTRYGTDDMSKTLVIGGVALSFLARVIRSGLVYWAGAIMVVIGLIRIFSPSASWQKRREEQDQFNKKTAGIRARLDKAAPRLRSQLRFLKLAITDKDHKYLKCSSCKRSLRVPRGQGNISVNCPYCKSKTKTRS